MRGPRHWRHRGMPAASAADHAPADVYPADPVNAPVTPAGLDGLLDEVRDLRLTLAADLATAAGATELGETAIASDILEGDRRELARFLRLADAQLRGERKPTPAAPGQPKWRRRVVVALPAIPLVGAMTLTAAAAAGALTLSGPTHHHSTARAAAPSTAVDSTFQQFKSVVTGDPSAAQVVAAATALHQQLSALLQSANTDPNNANEVAQLLLAERYLLAQTHVPGTSEVLAAASKLAARLRNVATPSASPAVVASPSASPKSTHSSSPSPSPSKSATTSPKASPSASPSSSPSASQSSSSGQIPHIGN